MRQAAVEAMARAMHLTTAAPSDGAKFWLPEAEAALDSLLAYLTEHASKWPSEELTIHGLVAVLRSTPGGDE